MTAYDDGLLAAQFAALAPEPLEGRWDDVLREAIGAQDDGTRLKHSAASQGRRRFLVLAATALVVVVVSASAFATTRSLFFGSGGTSFGNLAWSADGGKIYFLSDRRDGGRTVSTEVFVMNADGSGQRNLTRESGLDKEPIWSPFWSPNRQSIVFGSTRKGRFVPGLGPTTVTDVYTMNVGGTGRRRLARGITLVHWRTIDGQASTLNLLSFAWSPNGRRIAFVSNRASWRCGFRPSRKNKCDFEIYVMNADGSRQRNLTQRAGWWDLGPVWSPDGRMIAFDSMPNQIGRLHPDGRHEIYVMNADGSGQRMVAHGTGPAWSPDGSKIAFRSTRSGSGEVYVVNADGSGLRRLTNNPGSDGNPVWSRNGRKIFFEGRGDIHVMNSDGSGQRNLTRNRGGHAPQLSPDGRRILFVSERTGSAQIYVMNANGSGLKRLT
jgi:Tol biopolymer transport system component